MHYDIIGDVHGHADRLGQLLGRMGYRKHGSTWRQPGYQVIFVGDFIDRGPRQVDACRIVQSMVEEGDALATMGNHEFNAIAWHTRDPKSPHGDTLRTRLGLVGEKNRNQHSSFLVEVENTPEHDRIIQWFLTLPLWLDLPELRVVHACWHEQEMALLEAQLSAGRQMDLGLVERASRRGTAEYRAVECLLKGLEIDLPEGHAFRDKDGHERREVRVRWWDPTATTYRTAAILGDATKEGALPNLPIPETARVRSSSEKPVFFGHYWMTGTPRIQSPNVACVDYSAGKGKPLVAYRWQGESELNSAHFIASD